MLPELCEPTGMASTVKHAGLLGANYDFPGRSKAGPRTRPNSAPRAGLASASACRFKRSRHRKHSFCPGRAAGVAGSGLARRAGTGVQQPPRRRAFSCSTAQPGIGRAAARTRSRGLPAVRGEHYGRHAIRAVRVLARRLIEAGGPDRPGQTMGSPETPGTPTTSNFKRSGPLLPAGWIRGVAARSTISKGSRLLARRDGAVFRWASWPTPSSAGQTWGTPAYVPDGGTTGGSFYFALFAGAGVPAGPPGARPVGQTRRLPNSTSPVLPSNLGEYHLPRAGPVDPQTVVCRRLNPRCNERGGPTGPLF